ncbi:hypothetical protein [Paractinoplanes rishiriensis]|uniref:Uncharacterized protein n=1 Tax=Paractinoplanes rishiriensis TaxID=1050105 RepID=A0A919N2W6_9ACTN|nr:hypothetical protein [Actinoplanes rishiriensis]GIF02278.1 hypothetical protein Ari01nite_97420 [Actinoplanes rishiriensis]
MTISRTIRIVRRQRTAHDRGDQTVRARRDADRINALWQTGVWSVMWL